MAIGAEPRAAGVKLVDHGRHGEPPGPTGLHPIADARLLPHRELENREQGQEHDDGKNHRHEQLDQGEAMIGGRGQSGREVDHQHFSSTALLPL